MWLWVLLGCTDGNVKDKLTCRCLVRAGMWFSRHGSQFSGPKCLHCVWPSVWMVASVMRAVNYSSLGSGQASLASWPLVLCQMVLGSHRLPQQGKTHMSFFQVHCSLNRGSAVFPDVSLAMQGLNKQQQMGWPPLCSTKPQYDSQTRFAELLLTAGWFE